MGSLIKNKYLIWICFNLIQDPEDLPFKKGEMLTVINKDEEQWWTARNALGRVGAIPVPYIKPVSTYFIKYIMV